MTVADMNCQRCPAPSQLCQMNMIADLQLRFTKATPMDLVSSLCAEVTPTSYRSAAHERATLLNIITSGFAMLNHATLVFGLNRQNAADFP